MVTSRLALLVAIGCLAVGTSAAPTPDPKQPVLFAYARANLDDVLHLYSYLAGRPVYVEAGVGGIIDVMSGHTIPHDDALPWVRKLLLEHHGIQIEDTPQSIRVSWSAEHQAERDATKSTLSSPPPARTIDSSKPIAHASPSP